MTCNYLLTYKNVADVDVHIPLLAGDDGVRVDWRTDLNRNMSSTGIHETIVMNTLRYVSFDCYFTEREFHKLETWMSFGQQGQAFSFASDENKAINSALTATVTAGDIALPCDGTGLENGDFILVHDEMGTKWDVVEVSTATGALVTVYDGVTHDYSVGELVTYYTYFPNLLLLDDSFDPSRDGSYWHHTFNCVEVRNDSESI